MSQLSLSRSAALDPVEEALESIEGEPYHVVVPIPVDLYLHHLLDSFQIGFLRFAQRTLATSASATTTGAISGTFALGGFRGG